MNFKKFGTFSLAILISTSLAYEVLFGTYITASLASPDDNQACSIGSPIAIKITNWSSRRVIGEEYSIAVGKKGAALDRGELVHDSTIVEPRASRVRCLKSRYFTWPGATGGIEGKSARSQLSESLDQQAWYVNRSANAELRVTGTVVYAPIF